MKDVKRTFSTRRRRAMLASLIVITFAATLAMGQTPQQHSSKGLVIKGKTPLNKDVLKVKLPRAYETKLSNGLQVIVIEQHNLPTFAMQMVVLSGGMSDPDAGQGTAQFTASLLREGTATRKSKQLAEQIDALGAIVGATSGLSTFTSTVTASGLTDNFDQIMGLFADVILNPSFPADELNKLKTRSLAQLRLQRGQPTFLANEMFQKVLYGSHPASRVSLTAEEIQRLTPEVLRRFHSSYYRPNNAILAIIGDVKPAEVVGMLERAFGAWQRGDVPQPVLPGISETGPAKIYLIDRASSVQTNLILGNLTVERTDPDYYALDVMNQIVGGGPSARLFLNLREDKGYTYGAYSSFLALKYRGEFRATTDVRTEVTKGSMDELIYELKRIRDEKTPQDEFDRAKRSIIGRFAVQLESPQALLNDIMTQKLYGLPADYWDAYPQKISAITQDDVQRVAKKYLDLGHLQVVAVGDAGKIADVLKQYGTVEIYDIEGKPVKSAGGK